MVLGLKSRVRSVCTLSGHFGTVGAEVSGNFGTSANMTYGQFGTGAEVSWVG